MSDKRYRKRKILWLSILITAALLISSVVVMAQEGGNRFFPNPSKVVDLTSILHLPASNTDKNAKPGHSVWINHDSVDIFALWYEKEGYKNVESNNGEKVIAPGTEGTYPIKLENTKDYDCTYSVYVKTKFSIEGKERQDYKNPFEMGVSDRNGNLTMTNVSRYYTSDYDNEEDYGVKIDSGSLKPGDKAEYTLSWAWPFERGEWINSDTVYEYEYDNDLKSDDPKEDADMALGGYYLSKEAGVVTEEEAVEKYLNYNPPINLDTTITVLTEYTGRDNPKTGDYVQMLPWVSLALLMLMLIEIFLLVKDKKEEEEEE